jgi:hypothetical protein
MDGFPRPLLRGGTPIPHMAHIVFANEGYGPEIHRVTR